MTWVSPLNTGTQNPWGHYIIWQNTGVFPFLPHLVELGILKGNCKKQNLSLLQSLRVAALFWGVWRMNKLCFQKAAFRKPHSCPVVVQLCGCCSHRISRTCITYWKLKDMQKLWNTSPQRWRAVPYPAGTCVSNWERNAHQKRSAEGRHEGSKWRFFQCLSHCFQTNEPFLLLKLI